MSKKVIVLADNSYTIRRIVELSFSEIENIEISSFENGAGIKEKLMQLNPAVVIVDIKLPELNGYDVCRFINETPALKRARVFLMKGSFEPVDNEMIKNLQYEDIVTKPFDSNALVASVMKIVNQEEQGLAAGFAAEGPNTFPEEFAEIETEAPESEDISFSDIRGEMDAPPVFSHPAANLPPPERDDIQPSEEITQGAQLLKDDLILQEAEEPIKNPFDDEQTFDEIHAASAAARPALLEYEQEPPSAHPAASEPKNVSDEFHEHFLDIVNEDISEDILKTSLEAPSLATADELQFPPDLMKDEKPQEAEEKLALEFDKTDMGGPAQTIFAGPDALDFFASERKESAPNDLEKEVVRKEPVAEKVKPEAFSLQDELARLIAKPKKEAKAEPSAPAAPAPTVTVVGEKFELTGKLEDKLSQTIKELLWEIVPSLAEKIIKEEIDKIKSDLNDSGL